MSYLAPVEIAGKFTKEFVAIAQQTESCYIAVGMVTDKMFGFAKDRLVNCKDLRVITGIHMPTPPSVLKTLLEQTRIGNLRSGIFIDNFFHPKLYLFKVGVKWIAFVGSGNFTQGGWWANEELFIKVTDDTTCKHLLHYFDQWMADSKEITTTFLEDYELSFNISSELENRKRAQINDLIQSLGSDFNIDRIDFSSQFFKREEILAFQKGKTHLDTPEILSERKLARSKLYLLNDRVVDRLKKEWGLFPHYDADHIASQIQTEHHHEFNVRSLWVGYGRSKSQLKRYGGKDATPLFFMRMQFILSYERFGVWLMPGKINGGRADREYFLRQLGDETNCQRFFRLLNGLGGNYWIEIAGERLPVTSFSDAHSLRAFLSKDNWRYYYFIIGRDYAIGSPELAIDRIVDTCVADFTKYYPMYEMIRDRSFD